MVIGEGKGCGEGTPGIGVLTPQGPSAKILVLKIWLRGSYIVVCERNDNKWIKRRYCRSMHALNLC